VSFILAAWGFLKPLGKFLAVGITIPIWLMLAAGVWVYFDRGHVAQEAIKELVAGAELRAAHAKLDAQAEIAAEQKARADRLMLANQNFEASLAQTQQELEQTNAELDDIKSRPVNPDCVVDDSVLGRLHNN
jgi:hypothetical protein